MKKIISLILFFIGLNITAQQSISGTIKNVDLAPWIVLKESYGTNSRVLAKTQPLVNGAYSITLSDSLATGMYSLVYNLKENAAFNFYYNGESFELNFDAHPEIFDIQFVNNTESTWYYTQLNGLHSEERQMQALNDFAQNYEPKSKLNKHAVKEYNSRSRSIQKKKTLITAKLHPTLVFIHAQKRYYPPVKDDFLLQNYARIQHFFEGISATDSLLMHSNLYPNKVMEYISLYSNQNATEEGYIRAVDLTLNWASTNDVLHEMLIEFLAEGFSSFDMPMVIEHIDVQYKSRQCNADNDTALQNRLSTYNRLAIGNKAPNFSLGTTNLHDLESEYYTIAFWASWCGACESILPSVNKFLTNKPNVKSIAIGLDEDLVAWNLAKEAYVNFTHIRAKNKWDSKVVKSYGVYASPTFYVLDKEHKIVGKAKNVVELKALLP